MRILLLGQHGQLSQELQLSLQGQYELIVRGRSRLDLADSEQIRQQVRELRPELIINAAAHTAVDQAESEPGAAFALNARAPGVLAEEAASLGVPLIHYSTDYVFDGSGTDPLGPDDATAPANAYGRSKLEGELRVMTANPRSLIFRTAWVYSPFGKNFVKTMLALAEYFDHRHNQSRKA